MKDRVTNVLLVDDDDIDVINVQRALGRARTATPLFIATSGIEALAMLRGDDFPRTRRLVLVDLNMPRMSGIEFLRELRADPELRRTPVVVLTTSDASRDVIEAYDLQVAGFLLKPVSLAAFAEVLDALHRYWTLMEMP